MDKRTLVETGRPFLTNQWKVCLYCMCSMDRQNPCLILNFGSLVVFRNLCSKYWWLRSTFDGTYYVKACTLVPWLFFISLCSKYWGQRSMFDGLHVFCSRGKFSIFANNCLAQSRKNDWKSLVSHFLKTCWTISLFVPCLEPELQLNFSIYIHRQECSLLFPWGLRFSNKICCKIKW